MAQKCKTLNDFKFHTRENQRRVGLSGCVPVQEGYESMVVYIPYGSDFADAT